MKLRHGGDGDGSLAFETVSVRQQYIITNMKAQCDERRIWEISDP